MQLLLEHDLPFVTIEIVYRGAVLEVPRVIVDTGSATTLLSVDYVEPLALHLNLAIDCTTSMAWVGLSCPLCALWTASR